MINFLKLLHKKYKNSKVNKLDLIVKELEYHRQKLINILPNNLQEQFESESYIAGGSIYSMYQTNDFNDIDVFVQSEELKDKLLNHFKSLDGLSINLFEAESMYIGEYKGFKLIITSNAITIGDYQIILKDYGNPVDVVNQFDFKHNMFYIYKGKLHRLAPMSCLEGNELLYNEERARDIVGTIVRIPKFVSRGMTIKHKEIAKILLKLHKVGFNEKELKVLNSKMMNQSFGSGH